MTFSKVDLEYLRRAVKSGHLPPEKVVKVEALASGLTERGVRRAIRKAVARGHTDLAVLVQ